MKQNEQVEPQKEVKQSSYKPIMWVVLGVAITIAVVALIVFFSSFSKSSTSGVGAVVADLQQVGKTCRDTQVPYDYIEEYQETVPYTDTECEAKNLVYKRDGGECLDRVSGVFGIGDKPARYSCTITNLDSEGGTFSMRIGFKVGSQELETTSSKYIYPQSSETFSYSVDAKVDSCYCLEQVPTKQVCRDVTKYREVTKTRTVTRYKTEQVCE